MRTHKARSQVLPCRSKISLGLTNIWEAFGINQGSAREEEPNLVWGAEPSKKSSKTILLAEWAGKGLYTVAGWGVSIVAAGAF